MIIRSLFILVLVLLGVFSVTQGVGVKNFTKEDVTRKLEEMMKDPRKFAKNVPKYDPSDPKLKMIRASTKELLRKKLGGTVTEEKLDELVMEAERKFFDDHAKIKEEMEKEEEEEKRRKSEREREDL